MNKRSKSIPVLLIMVLLVSSFLPMMNVEALRYSTDTDIDTTDISHYGEHIHDYAGSRITTLGDVNGDGYDDWATYASGYDVSGENNNGKVYILFGHDETSTKNQNLSAADASYVGENTNDQAGFDVDGAGDVNGDGFGDIIIGAYGYDETNSNEGSAYIIFGKKSNWQNDVDLSDADLQYFGESSNDQAGYSVAGLGDFNGDGFDDVAVGAHMDDDGGVNAGQVYIIYGRSSGWPAGATSLIKANTSFIGKGSGEALGTAIAGAGDINNDGYDDIIIGAHYNDDNGHNAGEAYLIYGSPSDYGMDTNVAEAATASFEGEEADDHASSCVAGAGDVNGDGFDDILIGAYSGDGKAENTGAAYLVFGKVANWGMNTNISSGADVKYLGEASGDVLGWVGSCDGAGDVNGDGYDDIILGARGNNEGASSGGQAYLALGMGTFPTKNFDLSGSSDSSWYHSQTNARAGHSVSGQGDINGDGFDDIVVGAREVDKPWQPNYGKVYLIYPDMNTQPSSITNLKFYTSPTYSKVATQAKKNDTLYIELNSNDMPNVRRDTAVVFVNTSNAYPSGIKVRLLETGATTGVYHGYVKLSNRTRERHNWLKAEGNETLMVKTTSGTQKSHSIYILGDLKIVPELSTISIQEDLPYKQRFWGSGAPQLTYSFESNASWLNWSSTNNTAWGTPDNRDVGSYWVKITIQDNYEQKNILNYTLIVFNTDPIIKDQLLLAAIEDEPYSATLKADDQHDKHVWNISSPEWLTIQASSGVLTGTPTNDDVGTNYVNVTFQDGNGGTDTKVLQLVVRNSNDPPTILTEDVTTTNEDEQYRVDYLANDIDLNETFEWSLTPDRVADWLILDPETGTLQGTPTNDDVGNYSLNVTVMDSGNATDSREFNLEVLNVNDPPRIISTPITEATALIRYKYQVEVEEVDVGDNLEFWFDVMPEGMKMDALGNITWTPTREQGGDHQVAVRVSDSIETDLQTFSIKVTVPVKYPPLVSLGSPVNGSEINTTNPKLTWSCEDPDSTVVYFNVFFGEDLAKVSNKENSVQVAKDMTQTVYVHPEELEPGKTYYWTISSFDGEFKGKTPDGVWSFTVKQEAVASKEPSVVLNAPQDGAEIETLPVQLKWSGADPDSDLIYYDLYLDTVLQKVSLLDPSIKKLKDSTETAFLAEGLTRGKNYFWTVIPNDGVNTGKSLNGVWSFSVAEAVVQNHPPVINSTPVTEAFGGIGYQYQVIAIDEDSNDVLSYSLSVRPSGMVIDSQTGLIVWNPTDTQVGEHEVVIRVSDGNVYVEQTFTIDVRSQSEMNNKPIILDKTVPEAKVGRTFKFKVEATDLDTGDPLTFSIINGPDGLTIDPSTGDITWKPKKEQVGEQTVTVGVSDGKDDVEKDLTITVNKSDVVTDDGLSSMLPLLLLLVLIIVVIAILAVASRRRKKDDILPEPEEVLEETEADVQTSADAMYQPTEPVPMAVPVVAKEEAIEDFDITEVFVIYRDGRLITHSSTHEEEGIDKQLMSGMLVAIQGFVKESFQTEGGLDSFEFSGRKVLLQGENYLILATVLEGKEPEILREEMRSIITKLEGMYAGIIEQWDGRTDYFTDIRQYLLPLFKLKSKMKIKKKKKGVRVKSGVEFYSGYVRLKIGVSNGLDDIISNISLTLDFDHNTLSLSKIEPEYPYSDPNIFLPDIHPKEKRTVALYFDPVICQESHIDGWVTFTDPSGNQHESNMKRRPVDIVCPIFYTTENVNVAMLKRLLKELNYEDSRLFEANDVESLKEGYAVAVSTVKAHDVKFVREFKEENDFEVESWFYGEVKETDERLVIKVSASSSLEFLEIFVSSSNLASMTGLLAELSNVFRRKLDDIGLKERLIAHTDETVKDVIKQTKLLLDKFADSELDAGEIDQE